MPSYTIRPATLDDARSINAYRRRIAEEPNNMISYSPGEYYRTVEEERERIEGLLAADNSHLLVAVADNAIIGVCFGLGGVRVGRYTTSIGMSVDRAWRDQGVGTALVEATIRWARQNPEVHRLDLEVFTQNQRAIHLYRKLGFQAEGVRKEACFKEGQFIDTLMMSMIFHDAQ